MSLLDSIADLFLAGQCPGCFAPGWKMCSVCVRTINEGNVGQRWRESVTVPLWSAGDYVDPLRTAISQTKDHQRWECLPLLGRRLALAIADMSRHVDLSGPGSLIPIPSTASAVRTRGLDCVASTARLCSRWLKRAGLDVVTDHVLKFSTQVHDQGGLGATERGRNVHGRMVAFAPSSDRWAIIVDDVVTTGASISEGVRAAASVGHSVTGAATVAATVLRSGAAYRKT